MRWSSYWTECFGREWRRLCLRGSDPPVVGTEPTAARPPMPAAVMLIPSQVTCQAMFPQYHRKRSVRRHMHALLAVPPPPLPVPSLPAPANAAPIYGSPQPPQPHGRPAWPLLASLLPYCR